MEFRNFLFPGASLGENILPVEKKPHQRFRFSNNVTEKNFVFGNAPTNVRTMNTRIRKINNRKNTRNLFKRPTRLTPRTKPETKSNIINYEIEIERQRNQNNLTRRNVNRGINVASRKYPFGNQWLRQKKRLPKMSTWQLGYFNTINNMTRKAYKPTSNQAQKEAENWGRKVHRNLI